MAIDDKKISELVDVGEVNAANASMEVPANLSGQDVKFTPQMVVDYASKSTPTTAILSPVSYSYDKNTRVFTIINLGSGDIQYRIQGEPYTIPTGSNVTLPAFSTEKRLDVVYLSASGLEFETDENLVRNYNDKILLQVLNNLTVSFDDSNLLHKTGATYEFETVEGEKTFNKIYSKQTLGSQDVDLDLAAENPDEIDLLDASFVVCSSSGQINKISINFDVARWPGSGLRTDDTGDKEGIITGGSSRAMIVKAGTVVKHNAAVDDSGSFQEFRPVLTQTGEDYTATRDAMIILYYDRYRQVWRMAGYESVVEDIIQTEFEMWHEEMPCDVVFNGGLTYWVDNNNQSTIDLSNCTAEINGESRTIINSQFISATDGNMYNVKVFDSSGDLKYWIPCTEGVRNIRRCVLTGERFLVYGLIGFSIQTDFDILNTFGANRITESGEKMWVCNKTDKSNNYDKIQL